MYEIGALIAEKYRIDRVLGQGGMGMIVAATHVALGQPVAIKVLLDHMSNNELVIQRFEREARASAQLRSEHVCKVTDVGTLDSGAPYIVMELLDGRDLAAGGALSVVLAADYVLQACVGIAEAHSRGIVHRDLKPANLFLTARPDGSALIKVLDFGIAKATNDNADFSLTRTASVMGSPGYMSPEQLRSARDADTRSDIWALGIILFELVAGKPPFVATSLTEMALRVAMDPTPPLDVPAPPGFEDVIRRCLEKEPSARFQNVAELAQALAPFGAAHANETAAAIARVLAVQARPSISAPSIATTTTISSASGVTQAPATPKRRIGVIAAAAIVAVAGGIVAFTAVSGGKHEVAPATSPLPIASPTPTPTPPPIATPPPTPTPPIATPTPTPAATPPTTTKKPTAKKPTPTATPKDFGETRY